MKITQNQYNTKNKYNNNKHNSPFEFKYSSDVSNGYIQSKNLCLFNGVSDNMYCGGNSTFQCAYFLLSNPCKSKSNIYVKNSIISNHSSSAITAKIYYSVEDFEGNVESSNYFSITNSNFVGSISEGKIFSAHDLEKIYGIYGQNLVVPPFNMHNLHENGSIIISPGFSYVFEIMPINKEIASDIIVSFSWWEEDIPSFYD